MNWVLIVALFCLGLWGLVAKNNVVKKIIGLNLMNSAVVILFIYGGSIGGDTAPVLIGEITQIVDPVPQALMLTAIVIGVAITALSLGLVYRLYVRYHSLDIRVLEKAIND
jgi:multicomponent Na+:H+ antiporter subunit C